MESPAPGRYRLHDLLRTYAKERAQSGIPAVSILRLVIGLHPFYSTRGHWLDFQRICLAALEVAGDDRRAEGFLRNDLGLVLYDLAKGGTGHFDDSITELDRSLAIFEELADLRGVSMLLADLSHVLDLIGEYERAVDFGERALAVNQRLGNHFGLAISYIDIGNSQGKLGRTAAQRAAYDECIATGTEYGTDQQIAAAYFGSGVAYREGGQFALSVDHLRRSANGFEACNDRLGMAEALNELGITYRLMGSTEAAIEHLTEALAFTGQHDDDRRVLILHHLGLALETSGDHDAAVTYLQEAVALGTEKQLPNLTEVELAFRRLTAG